MKIIYILLINISLLFSSNIKKENTNTQDIRYVTVDILKLRAKPSIHSKQIGFLKYDEKVFVLKEINSKSKYNWVLTNKGYTSSNYLSRKLIFSNIKEINLDEKLNVKRKTNIIQKDKKNTETLHKELINKIFGFY